MRRLLYVPVIHSEADLGGLGPTVAREANALLTGERRALHRTTMEQFWRRAEDFLVSLGPRVLTVYQDGLTVDGSAGRRVVEEAAKRGSENYSLVLKLIEAGARLQKTEDAMLLLQERENILRLLEPKLSATGPRGAEEYRLQRDRLMEMRDRFIADVVSTTLGRGETGVLFIGAYHNVAEHLANDICVEAIRDPGSVRAYFEELLSGRNDTKLKQLALRLVAPGRP